jgi:hypothetical protein
MEEEEGEEEREEEGEEEKKDASGARLSGFQFLTRHTSIA